MIKVYYEVLFIVGNKVRVRFWQRVDEKDSQQVWIEVGGKNLQDKLFDIIKEKFKLEEFVLIKESL